jgi:hypothetical protein
VIDIVLGPLPDQVSSPGDQKLLVSFLGQTAIALQQGLPSGGIINKLEFFIARMDGCETHGSPDVTGHDRDWITDCAVQAEVLPYLRDAVRVLTPR